MSAEGTRVDDYLATLAAGTEEVRFLEAVPWTSGTHRQELAHVLKALRNEASWFAEHRAQPVFSLIAPLWNTPPRLLDELILSVRCQSWMGWELILVDDGSVSRDHLEVARRWAARDRRVRLFNLAENRGPSAARNEAIARSRGDFVAALDHDGLLHPQALGAFVRSLDNAPGANLLFSNEAKINEASDWVGFALNKPAFDVSTLLRVNYIGHFTAVRRDLLLAARREGMFFRPRFDGVEEHDLFVRLALTRQVDPIHVPLCLYYGRMIPPSPAGSTATMPELELKRRELLDELLLELYPGARWSIRAPSAAAGNRYPSIRLSAIERRPLPRLLVMVPFRDNSALTLRCLESLERQEHGLAVSVILINNRSQDEQTTRVLAGWLDRRRRNRYEVVDHDGAFNYARIHNRVIDRHGRDQDLLLFLNNDVELITPDCLQSLAMHLLAVAECAFAGIRLEFPDGGGIQHGGIKVHESELTCGCYPLLHAREHTDHVGDERIVFGVTFACAMVRREVYEDLGGLDEVMLPNSYGDVDIEARALELGYKNFYFGTLMGTHHESRSRGRSSEECEFLALHERHAGVISAWKLRGFTLSLQAWTTAPEPAAASEPSTAAEPVAAATPLIPLRYKLADGMNQALKVLLGPVHALLRSGLLVVHRGSSPADVPGSRRVDRAHRPTRRTRRQVIGEERVDQSGRSLGRR